jgi:hypothetical protein
MWKANSVVKSRPLPSGKASLWLSLDLSPTLVAISKNRGAALSGAGSSPPSTVVR